MLNYIPIKIEKEYEDEIKGKVLNLKKDPMYNRTFNKRYYGDAIADVPDMGIKKGDRVYFDYAETDVPRFHPEDDNIRYMEKPFVFAYVRDGEIHPVKGYVLCEPYYGEDIFEVEIEGHKVRTRQSKSGITYETDIKPDDRVARLTHTVNEDLKEAVGKLVFRDMYTNLEYEVEGKTMYIFEEDLVWGYFNEINENEINEELSEGKF